MSTGAASVSSDVVPPLGRTADQMLNAEVGTYMGKFWAATKAGQGLRKALDKSFALNEFVDNWYRSMAYLHGKTKAERGGLSETAALEEGVRAANRVLTDWDSLVPFERQILRTVFPFYGWMKHILKFTLSLPVDHPVRLSIIARFADNEIKDEGTGVPERFRQLYHFGTPDQFGNIMAINYRGTNPFSDVANYTTLAGFFGQLNPLIGGVAEAAGISGASGRADLYPEQTYDPETGKLIAKGGNVLETVATTVLPPLQVLTDRLGMSADDLRALKINNPQAYRNRVISALGFPALPQKFNLGRETALAEVARRTATNRAYSSALKSGDWRAASRYPQVAPLLRQIAQMDPSTLPLLQPMARYTEGQTPSLDALLGKP